MARGRKPMPEGERLSERVSVFFRRDEADELHGAANAAGLETSQHIRKLLGLPVVRKLAKHRKALTQT